MARKVLISFIGTGPLDKNTKSKRDYLRAKYRFNSKEKETSFVSTALMDFLNCDTVLLFGTMKSMWEEVYRYFALAKNNFDESYYYELAETCGEKANANTKLNAIDFRPISEVIGNDSKVIPIPYGLDNEEVKRIFEIFTEELKQNLRDGDEIYLDITHSFRSLPIYAQTTISLLTDVLGINVGFKGIYYGMLEVNRELGHAPIVDLSYMIDIQKFTKSAFAFELTGNAGLLVELLKEKNKPVSIKLKEFTKVLSLNFIHDIKSQIAVLKTLSNGKDYQLPESLIVPVAFNKFLSLFKNAQTLSDYQFLLSKWHFQKSAYALSFLCLIESIISYHLEQQGLTEEEVKNEYKRNEAKSKLESDLKDIYGPANQYRKVIAHVTEEHQKVYKDGRKLKISSNRAVPDLKNYIIKFEKIRNKHAH